MIDLASIRNASFTLTPTGYNPEEVDRFLADLADQLEAQPVSIEAAPPAPLSLPPTPAAPTSRRPRPAPRTSPGRCAPTPRTRLPASSRPPRTRRARPTRWSPP